MTDFKQGAVKKRPETDENESDKMADRFDTIRELFSSDEKRRDMNKKDPQNLLRFCDIVYGSDPEWNVLDIYRPAEALPEPEAALTHTTEMPPAPAAAPASASGTALRPLPVLVSIHGGAWVWGSKEDYRFYCEALSRMGFAVVNFTYRLAPQFHFPAPVEDTNAVMQWILSENHAQRYGLDTDRMVLIGDSAGAQILLQYLCLCTNPEYVRLMGIRPPQGLHIRRAVMNCGQYEVDMTRPHDFLVKIMRDYLPEGGSERDLKLVNALPYVTEQFPPSFIMTCSGDFLQKDAPKLAQKLMDCGVPFHFRYYTLRDLENEEDLRLQMSSGSGMFPDPGQMPGHVFHLDTGMPLADLCNREETEWILQELSQKN